VNFSNFQKKRFCTSRTTEQITAILRRDINIVDVSTVLGSNQSCTGFFSSAWKRISAREFDFPWVAAAEYSLLFKSPLGLLDSLKSPLLLTGGLRGGPGSEKI